MKNTFYKEYKEYLKTDHWAQLKEKLILLNPKARCWICEKTNTLLLHHEVYINLGNERLGRDVVILCFNCHTQVHFYKFLFIFTRRTKLKKRSLVKRRLFLRSKYFIQNQRKGLAIWYLFRYIIYI